MTQLVVFLLERGKCPVCGGKERIQVRHPVANGKPDVVGFVTCPCSDATPLVEWLAPFLDADASVPPNGVA